MQGFSKTEEIYWSAWDPQAMIKLWLSCSTWKNGNFFFFQISGGKGQAAGRGQGQGGVGERSLQDGFWLGTVWDDRRAAGL